MDAWPVYNSDADLRKAQERGELVDFMLTYRSRDDIKAKRNVTYKQAGFDSIPYWAMHIRMWKPDQEEQYIIDSWKKENGKV